MKTCFEIEAKIMQLSGGRRVPIILEPRPLDPEYPINQPSPGLGGCYWGTSI